MTTFDLEETYLFLDRAGGVGQAPGGPAFWANIGKSPMAGDTLVIVSEGHGDWPNWEMHPNGDEVLVILEGSPRFFLEHPDGRLESVATRPGATLVIPKGAWHRAEGPPGERVLFITYGAGTTHRPVTDEDRDRGRRASDEIARAALGETRTVLLVDWHQDVPRSLIAAGFEVLSTHDGWFRHSLVDTEPTDASASFAPSEPHHTGYLVARALDTPPTHVDMVCTYRPAPEQLAFVRDLAIPMGAKWFWVERGDERFTHPDSVVPGVSDEARAACAAAGVSVIEGLSVPAVLTGVQAQSR